MKKRLSRIILVTIGMVLLLTFGALGVAADSGEGGATASGWGDAFLVLHVSNGQDSAAGFSVIVTNARGTVVGGGSTDKWGWYIHTFAPGHYHYTIVKPCFKHLTGELDLRPWGYAWVFRDAVSQDTGGTLAPNSFTPPPDVTVAANSQCQATGVQLGWPTAATTCGAQLQISNDAPAVYPLGVTTVTWNARDAGGSTRTCTQKVTVVDQTPPTIAAPADLTVPTNEGCAATGVNLGQPTAGDNCSIVSVSNDAPAAFALGVTTVTWTARDGAGNTATATQRITVTDQTRPDIVAPADLTVPANEGCTAVNVNLGQATAADNCHVASLTNDAPAALPVGLNAIVWTAADDAGNVVTCTQRVTVTSPTQLVLIAPADVSVPTNQGCRAANVSLGQPGTPNSCGIQSITNNAPATFPLGATTVTWTATDDFGNTATARQKVTVYDSTGPTVTITSPANNAQVNGTVTLTATLGDDNVTDVAVMINGAIAATSLPFQWDTTLVQDGNYVITVVASDCAYNAGSASILLKVRNASEPVSAGLGHASPSQRKWQRLK
jgi:hypothetical protein